MTATMIATTSAQRLAVRAPAKVYLICLAILLAGYAFAGKGFAYLGFPPFYIGEIVLSIGFLMLFLGGYAWYLPKLPLFPLFMIFCAIGLARTIPYLPKYGVDAARDAVLWGYSLFALITAVLVGRSGSLVRGLLWYRKAIPAFLIFNLVFMAGFGLVAPLLPLWPGTEVSVIELRPGDVGCHLAGVGAFLLLKLHRTFPQARPTRRTEALWWLGWLVILGVVACDSRAAMVTVAFVLLLIVCFKGIGLRQAGLAAAVSILLLGASLGSFDLPGERSRSLSVEQLLDNAGSVFSDQNASFRNAETREWRIDWWDTILDYTIYGPLFWTGKGYGINLAVDDGFDTDNGKTRDPHNGHLTTLARSGVPGIVAWIVLQLSFAALLLRFYLKARRLRQEWWARVDLFIICYWAAFMINGSFDVFFESPQGAIWFWSVVGFGLAAAMTQRTLFATLSAGQAAQPAYRKKLPRGSAHALAKRGAA
ncbi:MAG TPA: O-antigen ligase family protein [Stellaceae bacterium]|nr:O-antigen ligase family protein [Stellaceae bacterium]